mmetsp:Transcript_59341/g.94226  ORF Transcript_59341/g.94226 Transcript_59341/m.94226 type:complete len:111 (+) Transcript_59341:422-754(+)
MMITKAIMQGIPIKGRITTHTAPATPRVQAVAGRQATQHDMAAILSPMKGPTQGMQSPATSNGPKQRQNATHMTIKPIKRNAHVRPVDSFESWVKRSSLLMVPWRRLYKE